MKESNKGLLLGLGLAAGIVLLAGWLSVRSFEESQPARSTPHTNTASPGFTYLGPGCMVEFQEQYSLFLPRGWYADTGEYHTDLWNYDATKIHYVHGAPLNLPDDAIKVELYTIQLESRQFLGERLRQFASSRQPLYQHAFVQYDWGRVKALGWKNPVDDQLLLEIDPGMGDWIISASIWDAPDSVLPQLFAILARLKTPADCPGWPEGEATFTVASGYQTQSTVLPYPYPASVLTAPILATPVFSYPYPALPNQPTLFSTSAPTKMSIPMAATNPVSIIKPLIRDLPHPIPGGGYSVSFIDAQRGWLLANPGPYRDVRTKQTSLFVTQDGGGHWEWLSDIGAFDIDFVSQQRGWGRGGQGLLVTGDGGLTWQEFSLPVEWFTNDWRLYTFDFESPERGWIVLSQDTPDSISSGQFRNYRLFRTTDGGSTWESLLLPCAGPDSSLTDYWERVVIHLSDQQDAWLVCSGNPLREWRPDSLHKLYGWLYHSRDDGQTWETMIQVSLWALYYNRPHGISTGDLPSISFADEQLGWVGTGSFGLLKTTDGGQTWQDMAMPWFLNLYFRDVHVFSPLHGLVAWSNSIGAHLAETQDGGESWQQIFPPLLPRQIQFFDAQNGIGLGSYPLQSNRFFRTSDGGRTWHPAGQIAVPCPVQGSVKVGCFEQVWSFDFLDLRKGFALTHAKKDTLYITRDGGATWTPLASLPSPNLEPDIDFIDEQTGFITRTDGIFMTRDGGKTFEALNRSGLAYPYVYEFITATEGVMSGDQQLYWTGDGGTTWSSVLQTRRIVEVDLQADGSIWVLSVEFNRTGRGDEIYLWFSSDHGVSWQRIDFGKDDPRTYPSFDFSDALHGWLRTSDHLYATVDGGRTWQMVR